MRGDKTALFEIAPYFDSQKKVTEYLGYHVLSNSESEIAKRIVLENTLFTRSEMIIHDSTTSKELLRFLSVKLDEISFSQPATSFLITPLESRNVRFEIRNLNTTKRNELNLLAKDLLSQDWAKELNIATFVDLKNPMALLEIASGLFQTRNRFNRYSFNADQYVNLLTLLTNSEIAVESEGRMTWHIDAEYEPEARLNLLIYFSKYYKDYKWDDAAGYFVNVSHSPQPVGQEIELFQLLSSKTDALAINAFVAITTQDSRKVAKLSEEYDRARVDTNFKLPTFPYRFLKQLSLLTEYCRDHSIDYEGTKRLKSQIDSLKSKLSFKDRYALENRMIEQLSTDEITAFEYWSLIDENSWPLTFSAGRIVNKFYSKNWTKITSDRKLLDLFLKKTVLFDNLGIVGLCNNYSNKFIGASPELIDWINSFSSSDPDIQKATSKLGPIFTKNIHSKIIPYRGESNDDFVISDPVKEIKTVISSKVESDDKEAAISKILSHINYDQMANVIRAVQSFSFKSHRSKYSFVDRDFGLVVEGDLEENEFRRSFLEDLSGLTQGQLYTKYLDATGVIYKSTSGDLDYDKIYGILKYDIVTPLAGGGNSKMTNHVYMIIKILELKFQTTLGFAKKLCNSNNMYACHADDRAFAWMDYLQDHDLLMNQPDEPVSISSER